MDGGVEFHADLYRPLLCLSVKVPVFAVVRRSDIWRGQEPVLDPGGAGAATVCHLWAGVCHHLFALLPDVCTCAAEEGAFAAQSAGGVRYEDQVIFATDDGGDRRLFIDTGAGA